MVKGSRARDGFIVDLSWENGKLTDARIQSVVVGKLHLRSGVKTAVYKLAKGETVTINGELKK
ncbi:MAG: hypothetical protein LBJ47_05410 [Tannerella sp.]|nr:hypothetical protein [Tannerella sp.]